MTAGPRARPAVADVVVFGGMIGVSLCFAETGPRALGLSVLALIAWLYARRGPFSRAAAIAAFLAAWFGSLLAGAASLALAWCLRRLVAGQGSASLQPPAVPPRTPTPDELEKRLRQEAGEEWALAALDHEDPEVRRRGVVALAGAPDGPPVEALARLLARVSRDRADYDAQLAAAEALGIPGRVEAIPALMAVLASSHHIWWFVEKAAVRGLVRIGDPAVCGSLVALFAKDHGLLEVEVTEALRAFGDAAVPCVLEGLRATDPRVRSRCANALARMKRRECAPALLAALGDADADVRARAVTASGDLGASEARVPMEDALCDETPAVRAAAAFALGRIGDGRSLDALLRVISHEQDEDVQRQLIECLGRLGDVRAVPAITGFLGQTPLRTESGEALVRIGGDQGRAAIRGFLRNRDFGVRLTAIQAAAALRDPGAIKPLSRILELRDEELRSAAAAALEDIKASGAHEPARDVPVDASPPTEQVIARLPSLGWHERRVAVDALAVAGQHAVAPLVEALNQTGPLVRWWCVEALRHIDGEQSRLALERVAREDPDERVRRRANLGS